MPLTQISPDLAAKQADWLVAFGRHVIGERYDLATMMRVGAARLLLDPLGMGLDIVVPHAPYAFLDAIGVSYDSDALSVFDAIGTDPRLSWVGVWRDLGQLTGDDLNAPAAVGAGMNPMHYLGDDVHCMRLIPIENPARPTQRRLRGLEIGRVAPSG